MYFSSKNEVPDWCEPVQGSGGVCGHLRIGNRSFFVGTELGKGARTRVHLAQDSWMGRKLSIKACECSSLMASQWFISLASASSKVSHPHIVPIYEFHPRVNETRYSLMMTE